MQVDYVCDWLGGVCMHVCVCVEHFHSRVLLVHVSHTARVNNAARTCLQC